MKNNLVLIMVFFFAFIANANQVIYHVPTNIEVGVWGDVMHRYDTLPCVMYFNIVDPIPLSEKAHDLSTFKIDYGDGTSSTLTSNRVQCDSHCAGYFHSKHAYTTHGKFKLLFYKNNVQFTTREFPT